MAKSGKEEIYFHGGLDTDSDAKYINQGDYVDALNINKFYDGTGGVIANSSGNIEIPFNPQGGGTNTCIGWCQDVENNAIIFFMHNTDNYHGIYRYFIDGGTFQSIMISSVLAFHVDCNNLQANVVGGMLYWNEGKDSDGDYINVPRKLNIERARIYTEQDSSTTVTGYSYINADTFSAIKKPSIDDLYATLQNDSTFTYNFLNATYYQFTFEVIFDDNERSVLSNRTNFLYTTVGSADNYVAIRFKYDDCGDTVSKLNVLYKKSFLDDFANGGSIDVYDPSNVYDSTNATAVTSTLVTDTYYVYRFYGKSGGAYYSGESTTLFDSLPIYANSQTYADNRIMYGGAKIGYDKPDVDMTFEVYNQPAADDLTGVTIQAFTSQAYGGHPNTSGFRITGLDDALATLLGTTFHSYGINLTLEAHVDVNPIQALVDLVSVSGSHAFTLPITQAQIRSAVLAYYTFTFRENGGPGGTAHAEWAVESGDYKLIVYAITTDVASNATLDTQSYVIDRNDNTYLLSGSYYQFCMFMFDDYFRTTGAIFNENTKVYIPVRTNVSAVPKWGIEWTVNERLPDWVKYVSFGYSLCLDFINVWQIETPTYDGGDFSFLYPVGYEFVAGDVLRIFNSNTVYQISSADATTTKIFMKSDFTYSTGSVEILRPRTTENASIFYEISKLYTYDVGGYVDGEILQDNGYFVGGDYTGVVYSSVKRLLSHLDVNGLLFYNYRRVIPEIDDYGDIEYQSVYFSQKYFDNTKVNGLNTFIYNNRADLSDENGDIVDLSRVGEVLHVYQRREITSFYLGKAILKQSSTGEVTADTSQVLGGKRESAFDLGTIFKTARMDNNTFGFDIYKGVFWMNAYNGVQPISGKGANSNYKMDTYFKRKAKALLDSGVENVRVLIGIEKPNELVYVTFIDSVTPANNDTIAYHQPSNRWISRYSFIPEMYAWLDDRVYMFKAGGIYESNDTTEGSTFTYSPNYFGVAYSSFIQFVTHASPNIIKLFDGIGIHADSQWTVDTIEADANKNYVDGFYSKILDSEFEREEGVYTASMPRNMKTRSSTASNFDRLNGELLRAPVIKIKLTNDETVKTELFKVDVSSTESA